MHRVDTATAVASLPSPQAAGTPGFFIKGDPSVPTQATTPGPDWFNMIQEELYYLVDQAGITPDASKADFTQVHEAIAAMIAAATAGIGGGAYDIGGSTGKDATGADLDAAVQPFAWFVVGRNSTVTGFRAKATDAPTGQAMNFDVKKNGVTLFTTPPSIAAAANNDGQAHVLDGATVSLVPFDLITFELTQIGSTNAGAGVTATLVCEAA